MANGAILTAEQERKLSLLMNMLLKSKKKLMS